MRPNGIIGLETALGLSITELVGRGLLSLPQLLQRMSTAPARIFNLPGRHARHGRAGRRRGLDPACSGRWSRRRSSRRAATPRSPVATLTGRAELTIVRGQVAFRRTP